MIQIDPTSIQGVKDLIKNLEKATEKSAEDTATDVTNNIERNLRTGYKNPIIGEGGTWVPISPQREHQLIKARLMPHEGLVAETHKLVGSLRMKKMDKNAFKISVTGEYAFTHEFGGGKSDVPPRPYFYPAINHLIVDKTHEKIIKDNVIEAVKVSQT